MPYFVTCSSVTGLHAWTYLTLWAASEGTWTQQTKDTCLTFAFIAIINFIIARIRLAQEGYLIEARGWYFDNILQ